MSIVLANESKAKLLETTRAYLNTLEYRLFFNNFIPAPGMTPVDFVETIDSGYAAKTPVFGPATLNLDNKGQLLAPTLTWTFNHDAGDLTVRGYWVYDPADSTVVFAERAVSDVLIDGAGQQYPVTPKYTRDTA